MLLLAGCDIFDDENEIFILNGRMNDSLTAPIVQLNSKNIDSDRKLSKRLSYFTIECFQNVIRHGEPIKEGIGKVTNGLFAYANKKDSIRVCTSNEVKLEDAIDFENRLSKLKSLDQESLKSMYMQVLETSKISEAGGAGLGLIDLMRKTKGNVNYKFIPKVNGRSDFLLETVINSGFVSDKNHTEDFQNFMESNNLIIFRKGMISKQGFLPICQLISIELNINEAISTDKYLFSILELVQNVCDHSIPEKVEHDCMFLQKIDDDGYSFYTGNLVTKATSEEILTILNRVNSYSSDELQLVNEKLMSDLIMSESNTGELGWVKIRMKLGSLINFHFEQFDDEFLMFYAGVQSV
jgi:hypothetical protein